jgi:hypothetical protein
MNFALDLRGFRSCCEYGAETRPAPKFRSPPPDQRRGFNSSTTMELPRYEVRGQGFEHRRFAALRHLVYTSDLLIIFSLPS